MVDVYNDSHYDEELSVDTIEWAKHHWKNFKKLLKRISKIEGNVVDLNSERLIHTTEIE